MKQILVIDDEPDILKLISKILEKAGYKVMTAENGRLADKLFNEYPFDLVITDIVMPQKEGLEIILQLKENSPDTKILAISGGGKIEFAEYLDAARATGAHAIVKKPFEISHLLNTVEQLLNS